MRARSAAIATYRPDIDGLRALAVIAVILVHVGASGMSGGFLGVDVFFVISGYLIHRDLVARFATGRPLIVDFYARRLRRTLPALYVALLLTATASAFILLPSDLVAFARSLLAALASVPNIFFLSQVGYFDADAATKPLLHAWSLGVEEQFYLVAPLLALLLRPLAPRGRAGVLLAAFVVAFAFSLLLGSAAPASAFYLMPARIFEFLIGAALAEAWLPRPRRRWTAELLAALGVAGLIVSFTTFDATLPHPGGTTLLPCLATAAVIQAGAAFPTVAGGLLSIRPLVWVGRISYSLYLYHWPILVLAHYAGLPTALPWRLGEGLLLVLLSAASYRFVEQPFRRPWSPLRRQARAILVPSAAGLAGLCILALAFGGLPGRFGPTVDAIAAFADYGAGRPFREGECFLTSRSSTGLDRAACLAPSDSESNVLLLGDSHAAHLWSGVRDAWPGLNVLQATASGCKPVLDATGTQRCTAMMRDMFERFIPAHRLDAVVLSALWSEADIEPLRRTLVALKREHQRAVVFGPLPRYDVPMATLLARAVLHGDPDAVARHRLPGTVALDARMRAAVAPLATYVSTYEAMCPGGACRLLAMRGVPMQFDYHHLTAPGAAALMATIAAQKPALFADHPARERLDVSKE